MKMNEGVADRVIRIAAGFLILSLLVLLEGASRWFALVGIVPLLTGLVGYCPLYAVFGLSTCPLEKRPS